MFPAIYQTQNDDKSVNTEFRDLNVDDLPDGDVLVKVQHTTLNYKDGLVLGNLGRLVPSFPHVPGIDFSGVVEDSQNGDFKAGDRVILTGWHVGERHWGGYAGMARVKGDWLIKAPKAIDNKRAMAVGTAGFTAAQAIHRLQERGLSPDRGSVLVTGAAGGVGSVAVKMLSKLGYHVAASTGRTETHAYLKELGATDIIDRAELAVAPERPLAKTRFAACIDAVGGDTLANVLTQMDYSGMVAAIGLAGGNALNTTVIPFLLRNVSLIGIDSVQAVKPEREAVWSMIAETLDAADIDATITAAKHSDLPQLGKDILKGGVKGRVVVDYADA